MSINIENLTKLINHLKRTKPKTFNMGQWLLFDWEKDWSSRPATELVERIETKGDCGTVACIAGHAALLIAAEKEYRSCAFRFIAKEEAAQWLGLNEEQAESLFLPRDELGYVTRYSLRQAIRTLEHFKKTTENGQPEIAWWD